MNLPMVRVAKSSLAWMFLVLLTCLLPYTSSFAQGCNQGIMNYTKTCDTAPGGVVQATRCSNLGDGGDVCEFCTLGHGVCVQTDGSQVSYTVANFAFDESCPGCGETPTCCNGGKECGLRYICGAYCTCEFASPIIVDTTGTGFRLTSAEDGVLFDVEGGGRQVKMAWTAPDSGNAFLALDRNHNGKIDNGQELFGNFTAQPKSDTRMATWPYRSLTSRKTAEMATE